MNSLKRLSLSGNFVNLDDFGIKDAMRDLEIKGVSVTVGSQKKRVISAENLILSLIGHPNSNHALGEYLEANGYFRLVDFVEDPSITEDEKIIAYQRWYQTLRNGKSVNDSEVSREIKDNSFPLLSTSLGRQGSLKLWWRLGRQNTISERVVCELHVTAQYRQSVR